MTTFSQLVDKMVAETKRPDLRVEVATFLNQTMREVHFDPKTGGSIMFSENYKESQLAVNLADGYSWTPPRPQCFQAPLAAKYDSVWVDGRPVWAELVKPGRGMSRGNDHWYYRGGSSFFFAGYGGINSTISMSWYEFVPSLVYYASAQRPAQYSLESEWEYADAVVTEEQKLVAREKTSNWLLIRWGEVIEEGLRAKIYKRVADTERARTSYSLFTTLRAGLVTSEEADGGGAW